MTPPKPAKPSPAVPASEAPAPPPAPKRRAADSPVQRLHPVQVEYSYPVGIRLGMERALPLDFEEEDPADWLETLSSPPEWDDRLAPVSASMNSDKLSGKNPLEVEMMFLHRLTVDLTRVAAEMERTNKGRFGETGAVACVGLGLDPETTVRLIDYDYETADNAHSRLDALITRGHVAPVGTTPFHTLLPLYKHDFELRLLIRMGLDFYWPLFKKYNRAVAKLHGERQFVATFWLPEGAYSARVLQMLHTEFVKRCEAEKITPAHLVIILDAEQSKEREIEQLTKRWNTLRPAPTTRDIVTVMYRERAFTDWVLGGHPSTKKQLDRTIAKMDAGLREAGIDHLWSHFEPLHTLLATFKSCQNFEQKLLKLTELGYQPCSPDVFARRKLLGLYGMEEDEPRRTTLRDSTSWSAYPDSAASLARFTGVEDSGTPGQPAVLAPDRPYSRRMPGGETQPEQGSQCWKPALMAALQAVHRAVVGEPKTFMGGMLGLMRELVPIPRIPVAMRNIEDFLILYARIRWKEHYVAHVCSEADVSLEEFCRNALLKDAPDDADELSDEAMVTMGAAAEAMYLAHEGLTSTAFAFENMDQRAVYSSVVTMTLAVSHAVYALKWNGKDAEAAELHRLFREELLSFEGAYTRHGIDKLGVDEATWKATIASHVDDSPLNVVSRAAKRTAAKSLRAFFRNDYARQDEHTSTSVGHLWSFEVEHDNFRWENELYCGIQEE